MEQETKDLPPTQPDTVDGDLRLAEEVLRKDRKATAEFVAHHADAVYAFIRRRVMPRPEAVEDLVQETFLAAWKGLANFRGESGLRAWLLGIARHKVEDYYRQRMREVLSPRDDDSSDESVIVPRYEEQLDRTRQQEEIQRTLASLPEAYSTVLLWRYLENRSVREMAQLAGKTEKAIERLLARAREQFRRRWNRAR
jgi:RNA polymerase sigma-70 factor (ECF subfamily)